MAKPANAAEAGNQCSMAGWEHLVGGTTVSLSPALAPVSTGATQIWPVAVIVVVIVLRVPAGILPTILPAVTGIVALMLGERLPTARTHTGATRS